MRKTTWPDVFGAVVATSAVAGFVLALAGWFVILPTVGLLYSFGVLP